MAGGVLDYQRTERIAIDWEESHLEDLSVYADPRRESVWLDRASIFEEEFSVEDCRRLIAALTEAIGKVEAAKQHG